MKLYTEEQVRKAYDKGLDNGFWGNSSSEHEDMALKELTPIELPSNDEIEKYIRSIYNFGLSQLVFEQGAKWMKEQILNQNK